MKIRHIFTLFTVFALTLLASFHGFAVMVPRDPELELARSVFIDDPKRVLGYDPQTDAICGAVNGNRDKPIVVCAHGFGDSKKNFVANLEKCLPGHDRDQFICFNFRDYRLDNGSMLPQLRYANLGQEPDARVVLFHVVKCFCKGHKNIVLFAHSRGCASTIRALDMLFDPYKYRSVWEAFGFTDKNGCILHGNSIRAIKNAVGRVYLARPLLSIREALLLAGKRATGSFLAPATAMLLRSVARLFGSYNTRTEEPIDILKRLLLQARFDFYLFFAPNDAVVGNRYDDLVSTTLAYDPANRSTLEAHSTGIEHVEVADAVCALRSYLAAQ